MFSWDLFFFARLHLVSTMHGPKFWGNIPCSNPSHLEEPSGLFLRVLVADFGWCVVSNLRFENSVAQTLPPLCMLEGFADHWSAEDLGHYYRSKVPGGAPQLRVVSPSGVSTGRYFSDCHICGGGHGLYSLCTWLQLRLVLLYYTPLLYIRINT